MKNHSVIKNILDLFFPITCVVCGEELLGEETGACIKCLYRLPVTNNFKVKGNTAEKFMAGRLLFDKIATYCVYSEGGILKPIIHSLKYYNNKEIGILLGRMFACDLLESDFLDTVDLIVPVPLHPKKLKNRGYNQSEIIAKGISDKTSIPISTGNLVRLINNPTQTKRTKTQRWDNVRGIFKVIEPMLFENKHILLVDDVITTGSTIEACGIALQRCNQLKISIATLGQVF